MASSSDTDSLCSLMAKVELERLKQRDLLRMILSGSGGWHHKNESDHEEARVLVELRPALTLTSVSDLDLLPIGMPRIPHNARAYKPA
jgi:hypothetical protein